MEIKENEKDFFSIPVDELIDNTQTHFDVYALIEDSDEKNDNNLILYAKAPYLWTLRELKELLKIGVNNLYINQNEKGVFVRYKDSLKQIPEVDHTMSAKFRIKQISSIGAHLLEACFISELNEEKSKAINNLSNEIVLALEEDLTSVKQIEMLCEHSLYTYVHSVSTGIYATAIAIQLGIKDKKVLKEYALSGLFHDIGKKNIPLDVLNKVGPLNKEEWAQMCTHPQKGHELIKDLDISKFVLGAITNHHEKLDGSGYPNNIMRSEIPEHVPIITVADIFSALTTTRCYHMKRSRYEALMLMKHDLKGKISLDAFNALVKCLILEKT